MNIVDSYKNEFISYLNKKAIVKEPKNLYKPIDYILQLGGKRLRPVLTLMTCDLYGGNVNEAFDAALAIEVFHNFTLIHDDIMDEAPIRRGKKTVHNKWNLNAGILSGDAMLIMAYQFFENYEAETFKKLMKIFSKTALEVCEGQQLDIDFETRNDVTIEEYLQMIKNKTSVLVAAAMQMGAIVANANEKESEIIYNYGLNLGIAFQLQDDYLDTFGNTEEFGKQIGGDIKENKKTFLYLKALEKCTKYDKQKLLSLYANKEIDTKVTEVTRLFEKNDIPEITLSEIEKYTNKAFDVLKDSSLPNDKKEVLKDFGHSLMKRTI